LPAGPSRTNWYGGEAKRIGRGVQRNKVRNFLAGLRIGKTILIYLLVNLLIGIFIVSF
jgi:hypothetical protein